MEKRANLTLRRNIPDKLSGEMLRRCLFGHLFYLCFMQVLGTAIWACVGLLWAQNLGIGTLNPTERLDVEGGRLRVRAYSGTGIRLATVDPNGVFGTLNGAAVGEVLTWDGTQWRGIIEESLKSLHRN